MSDGEEGLLHFIMIAAKFDSEYKIIFSRHFDRTTDPQV